MIHFLLAAWAEFVDAILTQPFWTVLGVIAFITVLIGAPAIAAFIFAVLLGIFWWFGYVPADVNVNDED